MLEARVLKYALLYTVVYPELWRYQGTCTLMANTAVASVL